MPRTPRKTTKPKPAPATRPAPKSDSLEALLLRLVSPLNSLPVQNLEGVFYFRPENIAYISTSPTKGDDDLLVYDLDGNEGRLSIGLTNLARILAPDPRFCRSHRSFIVNAFVIEAIYTDPKTGRMEASFGKKVKGRAGISRDGYKDLKPLLELDLSA